MHHPLSRPDWLQELNDALPTRNLRGHLHFDEDFVRVEADYLNGFEPGDVARRIHEGTHLTIARSEFYKL